LVIQGIGLPIRLFFPGVSKNGNLFKEKWSRGLLWPLPQMLVVSTKETSPGELLLLKTFLSMKKHQILQPPCTGTSLQEDCGFPKCCADLSFSHAWFKNLYVMSHLGQCQGKDQFEKRNPSQEMRKLLNNYIFFLGIFSPLIFVKK